MTLQEKGPIAPPPALAGPAQRVNATVQSWPDVISAAHWHLYHPGQVDGADFYVGYEELGHIHLNGEVHLPTSPALFQTLMAEGKASRFPYGNSESQQWLLFTIRTESDADYALTLFKRNYERILATVA